MSIESEQQIVGAMLANWKCDDVVEMVEPKMFTNAGLRALYEYLVGMYHQGKENSVAMVIARFKYESEDDQAMIVDLYEYLDRNGTLDYAKFIVEDWRKSESEKLVQEFISESFGQSSDEVLELTQKLARNMEELSDIKDQKRSWKQLIKDTLKNIDERANREDSVIGQRIGIPFFDEMLGGFKDKNLITIAGRPAMGKSTLAWQAMLAGAMNNPDRYYIGFTLEMSEEELMERYFSQVSRVFLGKITSGKMKEDDFNRLAASVAVDLSHKENMEFFDLSRPRPEKIYKEIRKAARTHKMGMVVIDAPYLCRLNEDKLRHELAGMTKTLKAMSKEIDCPIVVIHQLSKDLERRNDKRPLLADLKETGGFEEDSDVVIFIYRDEVYTREKSKFKGGAELIIAKNRQGRSGVSPVRAELEVNRFRDYQAGEANPFVRND